MSANRSKLHRVHVPLTRRDMLRRCADGFGSVALGALLQDQAFARAPAGAQNPRPHHVPRVRSVIMLYMDGGPSQVDTLGQEKFVSTQSAPLSTAHRAHNA